METYAIDALGQGIRADVYLATLIPSLSRSRIQSLIKSGGIQLNGSTFKSGKLLEAGDIITREIPPMTRMSVEPCPMELDIIYEDSSLLVINKPKGLVVHPSPGSDEKTLVHGLLARCPDLSGINGVERPGIVHRLDKNTSGLLVVAKTDQAHRGLSEQIAERTMTRRYLAVVWGIVNEPSGLIDAPINRDPDNRQRMAVMSGGRQAVTVYKTLDRLVKSGKTVLLCELRTGRTHQIRAHLKFLGYPVVGDAKYGRRKDDPYWNGQALHSFCLGFRHPVSGEEQMFYAAPPDEFMGFLREQNAENALAEINKAANSC